MNSEALKSIKESDAISESVELPCNMTFFYAETEMGLHGFLRQRGTVLPV